MTKKDSIDILITFDTTGSMYPCLTQVRREISNVIKTLFRDIPNLRVGIIAHGDYCDYKKPYVTKIFDLTTNEKNLISFVESVEKTGGGDSPECYELVLNQARTDINWKSGISKAIIMIGDDVPHNKGYVHGSFKVDIDWKNEIGLINEAGIKIYGIHAMPGTRGHSRKFYQTISEKTDGHYLTLDQFSNIVDIIMAVCYKQDSEESLVSFVKSVRKNKHLTRDFANAVTSMSRRVATEFADISVFTETKSSLVYDSGLNPVPSGRFQVIPVEETRTIRSFVEEQGIDFNPGRGFYELVRHGKKRYKVQQYKEIILMDRITGDLFNGSEVRDTLGLEPQIEIIGKDRGIVESLPPRSLDDYRVFIQSTSHTRKLVPGSNMLYEVPDWER